MTSFVAVGLMLTLITVNLSTSFNDFINETEHQQVATLKQRMVAFYQQHQSWDPLKNNDPLWRSMLGANTKQTSLTPSELEQHKLEKAENVSTLSHLLQTRRRLSLYDMDGQVVVGRPLHTENASKEAIELNGQQIGWISLIPSQLSEGSPGNEFLAQQYKSYYVIALSVIALAFITAWLFSRHLVAPISALINGTYTLIKGNYTVRIEKKTNDELALLSDNVNILAETLDKNQHNRAKWMSDVSHELKTPLTVLRGQLIGIQDDVFVADEQRIQLFIDQIDSMSNIVNDLYQLSSTDAGGLTYKKEPLNPIQIALQVADSFSTQFKQKNLHVDCTQVTTLLGETECSVLADKDRLRQLFVNLFENTYRYTDAPGHIQISASIINQQVTIQLQDSAPSVPTSEQPHLFERFYRVEPSRNRNSGGSGLGLALCKQIVDAHQGTICTSTSSLGGLSIEITFPLYRNY